MAKEFKDIPDWQKKAQAESWMQNESAMAGIITAKVYNKWIQTKDVEDPAKAGKILFKTGQEWEVMWDEMNVNILMVRKFYTGFVPRLNEFGDTVKDENWNAIKDFYYTPEVDVFSKENIPLGRIRDWIKEVIGRWPKTTFDELCKAPKVDGKDNPLLKEVKKNDQTWEKYAVSYMKLWYVIYAKNLDDWEYIKIIPGWSYGRFNDIQPWTFEDLMLQAKNQYKEIYWSYVLREFIKAKVWVTITERWFYAFDWKLDWFIVEDNSEELEYIRDVVNTFNKDRFKGIDFDQPMQSLPYNNVLTIEAPKKEEVIEDWWISVEDIPF